MTYQREHADSILFNEISPVCKFQFLKGYVFRRNDPAVFGAEILIGKLRQKVSVMNEHGKKNWNNSSNSRGGKNLSDARGRNPSGSFHERASHWQADKRRRYLLYRFNKQRGKIIG